MTRISELQIARNAETREAWDTFAPHRERITELLQSLATSDSCSLCVFGAGNCNDLDLEKLLASYASIQLVDIDGRALAAGVKRQAARADGLHELADFDVTGVAPLLSAWSPEVPASPIDVDRCLASLQKAPRPPGGPFTVVVSTCLLSQLIDALVHTLGERHPRFLEVMTTVRMQHLKLLAELAAPGGAVVLVSDIVSSATCPQLLQASEANLPQVVSDAINARNFFTGVNPVVLRSQFLHEPTLSSVSKSVELTDPWLWNLGPRSYAVCAIVARMN